jgi:crotonobetainyl-CoA:carnitine CoA-transferase CaiB-like acyl-CoA transferase
MTQMAGAFTDITVLEIGRFVSVPFCGQLLADGGARVIKVEPIHGDPYRSAHPVAPGESRQFLIKNRGKESLPLDFAKQEGREILAELIASADVVLANLSPRAAARHGLDYQSVRAIREDVIYGSVTGFGRHGPDAGLAGMDVVAQAQSGLLTALAAERDQVPLHSEVQAADYAASLLLFGGIASALYSRERTGQGQEVAVSLLGAALTLQNNSLFHLEEHDEWRTTFVHETLPELRRSNASVAEIEAARTANRPDVSTHRAHYKVFAALDGHLAVGAGSPATRRALLEIVAEGETGELADYPLDAIFAGRTIDDWVETLQAAGVPVGRVRHIEEMPFDQHVLEEGLVVQNEHPTLGQVRVLGVPIQLSATPFAADRPSPAFGGHVRQILTEIGFATEAVDALIADGVVAVEIDPNHSKETTNDLHT